jgi:hypothetical protein
MTAKPTPRLPSGQTVVWREENLTSYYANIMAFAMTPFDISLTFGEIGHATMTEVEAHAKAKIILAPEQAKNLLQLLTIAVDKYVQGNGSLRDSGALNKEMFSDAMEKNRVETPSES